MQLVNDLTFRTEVYADPFVAEVLYNLMDNEVHYGASITTLRFSPEERAGDRTIICEDDGDGVPAW